MDNDEGFGWDENRCWHPAYRAAMQELYPNCITIPGTTHWIDQSWLDYSEYWAGQRDADGLPEVWQ